MLFTLYAGGKRGRGRKYITYPVQTRGQAPFFLSQNMWHVSWLSNLVSQNMLHLLYMKQWAQN